MSSVDDPMHRTLNCKCKSEDAGPWHGHGLEREWAWPATRFGTEMFIFTRFLKGIILYKIKLDILLVLQANLAIRVWVFQVICRITVNCLI